MGPIVYLGVSEWISWVERIYEGDTNHISHVVCDNGKETVLLEV